MIRFGQDEVVQLAQGIWQAMLSLPLRPVGQDQSGLSVVGTAASKCDLAACVQITGAWKGAVRIDCSELLAKRTAAVFLGLPAGEVSREEMLDALGEVTNMMAGSIKPLLPRPCQISLPSVVDGADYELNIRKGQLLLASEFESDGDKLKISLVEAHLQPQSPAARR
jgi:chemotaxis protein CheX